MEGTAAFQRMADVLEPINTVLEMGLASIVSCRPTEREQDAEGNFITDWETILEGTYSTEYPLVGARFAHGRVAGSSRNASRIYHRRSPSHSTIV